MFAPVYTHVPAEILHSRDFSLLAALLSLKAGVSLFLPVPDSKAGAMIVLPWSPSHTQHNRLRRSSLISAQTRQRLLPIRLGIVFLFV